MINKIIFVLIIFIFAYGFLIIGCKGGEEMKVAATTGAAVPESLAPYPEGGVFFSEEEFNTEEYGRIYENRFLKVVDNPLSTFSIDVDTASYSNARRFLTGGSLPPEAPRVRARQSRRDSRPD